MSSKEIYKVGLRANGKVQGVFYRVSTKDKAQSLGVTGFVRNRLDGSVQIVAFGSQEQLDAMAEWARNGPPGAVVNSVDVENERILVKGEDIPDSFDILRSN